MSNLVRSVLLVCSASALSSSYLACFRHRMRLLDDCFWKKLLLVFLLDHLAWRHRF